VYERAGFDFFAEENDGCFDVVFKEVVDAQGVRAEYDAVDQGRTVNLAHEKLAFAGASGLVDTQGAAASMRAFLDAIGEFSEERWAHLRGAHAD